MDFGPHLFLAVLEGTVTAAVLALTALGLSLVFGVMRVVNVAHGEFFMLGAVLAWWFSSLVAGSPALGFLLALVLSPLVVGAVAILCERTVLRRIDYDPEATIVATIGLLYIIQQLALTFYGPDARPVPAPVSFRIQFPWFGWSGYKLVVVAASAVLLVGAWLVLTRTRLGLVMRATQLDRETAQAFGDPGRPRLRPGVRLGRHAGRDRRGADRADPAGALPDGARPAALVLHRRHHRRAGQHPGHGGGRRHRRPERRHHLGVLLPTLAKILATLLVALVLVVRPQGLFGRRRGEPARTRRLPW